jgi:hypothetical protein
LLPDLGFIEAEGADAQPFLHAQLSRDIAALGYDRAPLAGWHDARGRLRALVRVVRLAERWLLITPRDTVEPVLSGLRLYVLRARITLTVNDSWQSAALVGDPDRWLGAHGVELTAEPDGLLRHGSLHWLRLGPELIHALGPAPSVAELGTQLDVAPPDIATLGEIRRGIPAVPHALAERFLPQMLNLDRLGAVSFNKGCYPGQEVINRIHNLGRVKRRMRRYSTESPRVPAPGTSVVDGGGREVGEVVRAAPAESGIELLAVVQNDAARIPLFVEGATESAPLTEQPLPYDISE